MHESHLLPNPHPFLRAELKAVTIRGHCNVIQRRFIDYDHALRWHCAIYTSDLIPRKWNPFLKMLDVFNKPCWIMMCLQWWRFPMKRKWTAEFQENLFNGSMINLCYSCVSREVVRNDDQDKTEFHQKRVILKKKVQIHLHMIIWQCSGHPIPSLTHNSHLFYPPLYL